MMKHLNQSRRRSIRRKVACEKRYLCRGDLGERDNAKMMEMKKEEDKKERINGGKRRE